jgi:SurA-like N-terminal domain
LRALAVCALGILLIPLAGRAETLDRVVASVDYRAITDCDVELEFHYEQLLNGVQPAGMPAAQAREQIRNRLVEQMLLAEEAQDSKVPAVTQETLAQDVADIQKKLGSPEAFQAALGAAGLNADQLLDRLRRRDTIERLTDLRLRPQVWVESSEIEKYYNQTFLPSFKAHNQSQPPALDEVEGKIREILTEEKINKLLDSWISELKATHRVVLHSTSIATGPPA